jgi:hypothetical protein
MNGATSRRHMRTSCQVSSDSIAKLRINLSSGETKLLDLPRQFGEWSSLRQDPSFQARIRGIVLIHNGQSYALPAPRAFRRVLYDVELLPGREPVQGENVPPAAIRASYAADAVTASMTLHLGGSPPMVRFDVKASGNLRWMAP